MTDFRDRPDPAVVEHGLAQRLRTMDLAKLQPGMRDRAWEEFALRMDLPAQPLPPAPAALGDPPEGPAVAPEDLTPPTSADVLRRLGFTRVPAPPPRRAARPA